MEVGHQETAVVRKGKRPAAKASSRLTADKVKCTITLSVSASQRLGVHAEMTGQDRSEVMEGLINQHLRRFVVSDRGGPESGNSEIAESRNA
jgi:hypothetical protein